MKKPHIEITTDGVKTEVHIDGKKVNGVRKVSFIQDACNVPTLQIDLLATDLSIDANMIPALPEIFQEFYRPIAIESPEVEEITDNPVRC